MTSIRAPWRARPPRDGRDGLDALPAGPGTPGAAGKDGAPGDRGPRGPGGAVIREVVAQPAQSTLPWRGVWERDEASRLTLRVQAGPAGGAAQIELIPYRDESDDIVFVDILPVAA